MRNKEKEKVKDKKRNFSNVKGKIKGKERFKLRVLRIVSLVTTLSLITVSCSKKLDEGKSPGPQMNTKVEQIQITTVAGTTSPENKISTSSGNSLESTTTIEGNGANSKDIKTSEEVKDIETTVEITKEEIVEKEAEGSLKEDSFYMGLDNEKKGWSHAYPEDLSNYEGIYSVKENEVTLSFDLGTETGYTEALLDLLKEKNIKALFFLTGTYIEANKDLVNRMINEGHTIGCHGYNHEDMNILVENGPEGLVEDLNKWRDVSPVATSYFRAPSGVYSYRGMEILKDLGYKSIFWGLAYRDWEENNQMEPEAALDKLKETLQPGDVILLHVFKTNITILPDFIDWLRQEGYSIVIP